MSSNDDKRIQTYDKVTTCPYGTNVFMVCKNEMQLKKKRKIDRKLMIINQFLRITLKC